MTPKHDTKDSLNETATKTGFSSSLECTSVCQKKRNINARKFKCKHAKGKKKFINRPHLLILWFGWVIYDGNKMEQLFKDRTKIEDRQQNTIFKQTPMATEATI